MSKCALLDGGEDGHVSSRASVTIGNHLGGRLSLDTFDGRTLMEHKLFFLKLFGLLRDIPAKSRDIPPKKFDFPGFEGHTELFGPHPFTLKTPPPHPKISGPKSLGLGWGADWGQQFLSDGPMSFAICGASPYCQAHVAQLWSSLSKTRGVAFLWRHGVLSVQC